jgi:hypothetical protein
VARYQTDLLVYDEVNGGEHWVPRVVVECKIRGITTHDALITAARRRRTSRSIPTFGT